MALTITSINHVQVTVPPRLEGQCKAFYGDLLGLREIEKPEPLRSRGGAWYEIGPKTNPLQLHLSLEDGADGNTSKRHICYLVPDLGAAKAQFEASGIEITDEATEPNGLKRFFIRDPAGNKIEIGMLDGDL